MNKATAFIDIPRTNAPKRPVDQRIKDWQEVEGELSPADLRLQAARCMDCGIAFCHKGCPLGNHVPDWNDLVYTNSLQHASARLHATNNFPEFTGRICPAPCEEACVLNINTKPVTIRQIEKQIADNAWTQNWLPPQPPSTETGKSVAVVGSGPAGLAAAQQLRRAGHAVTVFERDDRPGGLLRYGIPDFKLEKSLIDRRLTQLQAEGVRFETHQNLGENLLLETLEADFDAVLLCIGAQQPRPLQIPGTNLRGVYLAMDYLTAANRALSHHPVDTPICAAGKRVLVLGGGDTGADCVGTAHRQGAADVLNFHHKPAPPSERTPHMPWPWWPIVLRESTSHEEGGSREWSVVATRFSADINGQVRRLHCTRVEWREGADGRLSANQLPDTELVLEVDLVLVAIGFTGPEVEHSTALSALLSSTGTIEVDDRYQTKRNAVFACGDATRGASLVVWAIWEGRETARCIDIHLQGDSQLPTIPNTHPI